MAAKMADDTNRKIPSELVEAQVIPLFYSKTSSEQSVLGGIFAILDQCSQMSCSMSRQSDSANGNCIF